MTTRGKKIFLSLTVIAPLLMYCIIYYIPIFRNAPFRADEFVSFQFKWGTGEHLDNTYDSATGDYRYLDSRDSLIKTNLKLRKDDISYLHHKASELGLWNFPDVIANTGEDLKSPKTLRYEIQFNYKRKSKKVVFLTDYNEIPKLKDVAFQMQKLIGQTLDDAEDRYGNK